MRYSSIYLPLVCIALLSGCGIETTTTIPVTVTTTQPANSSSDAPLEEIELGSTKNVHQRGNIIFAGQFQAADIPAIKEAGVTQVISLRTEGEIDWDEAKAVNEAGLKHVSVAFGSGEELTDDKIQQLRELLGHEDGKTMLHCGSANRVASVWIAHRVLDGGADLETAIEEAKTIGLKSEQLKERVIEYVKQQQGEATDE